MHLSIQETRPALTESLASIPCYTHPVEPDDIQIASVVWDDIYIPEMARQALDTANQYPDWELQVQISAHAIYCANFLNPN